MSAPVPKPIQIPAAKHSHQAAVPEVKSVPRSISAPPVTVQKPVAPAMPNDSKRNVFTKSFRGSHSDAPKTAPNGLGVVTNPVPSLKSPAPQPAPTKIANAIRDQIEAHRHNDSPKGVPAAKPNPGVPATLVTPGKQAQAVVVRSHDHKKGSVAIPPQPIPSSTASVLRNQAQNFAKFRDRNHDHDHAPVRIGGDQHRPTPIDGVIPVPNRVNPPKQAQVHHHNDHDNHNHSHSHGGFGSNRFGSNRSNLWLSLLLGGSGYGPGGFGYGNGYGYGNGFGYRPGFGAGYGPRFCGSGFGGGYGGGTCIGTGLVAGCAPLLLQDSFVTASAAPTTVISTTSLSPAPSTSSAIISPDEFNSLKFGDQRKLLIQTAAQFRTELLVAENGDAWVRHLRLNDVATIVGEGDEPPKPEVRQQLSQVADLFDDTFRNPQFQDVARPAAFHTLRVGLREFSTEPVVHLRRLLTASAQELAAKLNEWETGDRWRTYLRLETLLTLDDSLAQAALKLNDLDALNAKFERVETDPTYEVVKKEEAFQHTRLALQWYLTELQKVLAAQNPQPLPQTLPLPE